MKCLDFLGVMRERRHHPPDRARPRGIAAAPRDDVDVKLRHDVAQGGDIQFVGLGDIFQRARETRVISVISCACSTSSRSMISTTSGRRGTSSSHG